MSKLKSLLCICLCFLMLCACGQKDPEFITPANFYYCNHTVSYNTPDGLIRPEVRETDGIEKDISRYLTEYLCGPVSDELYSVIPQNTVLISVQIQETTAMLHFSEAFAELSGIELTTASVCLVKSLYDFAGVESVVLSAEGSLLDEKETYLLSLEDIVTMDAVTMEE